jgi:hypothetical protein
MKRQSFLSHCTTIPPFVTVNPGHEPSITAAVVARTFLISIATDAGGDLLLEFIPSVIHRFPIMRELRIE